MSKFALPDSVKLPESLLELSQHLGFSRFENTKWAWYELSGSVHSHYLVNRQQRFDALLNWFYRILGFRQREDYFSSEAADLGTCLLSRHGNSTTLAVLLQLLAKQLDLTLDVIFLPGHTVLRASIDDKPKFIDPLNGRPLCRDMLHAFVRGELGNHAPLKAGYLKPVSPIRIMSVMMHELKAGCIVSHQFEQALECCNLLMRRHSDDVQLNRERAFIAEQLGCTKMAKEDLEYFVEQSPHDPVTESVKIRLQKLSDTQETYH